MRLRILFIIFIFLLISPCHIKVAHQQILQLLGPNSIFGFNNLNSANIMECKRFFENITNVESLNHHQYSSFENCIYYFLANRVQQQVVSSGLHFGSASFQPISSLPPSFNQIKLFVAKITIQHFQLNEFLRSLDIVGYLELRWRDERLTWDQPQFKVSQIRIASASHIWLPYLTGQGSETALHNDNEQMEVRRIDVKNNGNVTAIMGFKFSTFCDDTDFKHFPNDVYKCYIYKCCFYLEPLISRPLVKLVADGQPVFTDPKYFRDYGWSLTGSIPSIFQDPSNITQMGFCLNLQRTTSTLKTELEVPAFACGLLLFFSPVLGLISSIKIQIYSKFFLLLLQFINLLLFSQRIAPQMGSSSGTPIIVQVHEFGLVLNLISIILSSTVMALTKLRIYNHPPWDLLIYISTLINKFVKIFDSTSDHEDLEQLEMKKEIETSNENENAQKENIMNRFRSDWIRCFLSLHVIGYLLIH
ncbi:Neur_chan_LBD domain-containing protein [Meloidogyne graminicola]|uniref:Neur_chan_LBD domain-containing protein n=1 Tax=Meloidogyne graminicola TaxID=189291 RepID=A0A8S9ZFK2_9BILA|nr:Neur_chan_LBD domain-containing protein [Meloidogyne graminicola]